jgi:membrane protein DedA with SNARE-associated domain
MSLPDILVFATGLASFLKYPLISVGTAINGPIIIFASGMLIHLGVLDAFPAFLALVFGELAQDILFYWLGYRYGDEAVKKFGRYVSITEDVFAKIKTFFSSHGLYVLFGAKLTMGGFGTMLMILLTAGATKIPFWRYLAVAVAGELVWVSAVLGLGFWLGRFSQTVATNFRMAFLAGTLAMAFALAFGVSGYIRSRILQSRK